jgi:hypothetical protein
MVAVIADIATGHGLNDRGVRVRVPARERFLPLHVVHTGSGAHPASYPKSVRGSFLVDNAAGT